MSYLTDTGFWYVSIDSSDEHYSRVASVAGQIRKQVIFPIPVITETAYLILKNRGVDSLAVFAESLSSSLFALETPIAADYARTAVILRKYNDANIDFVDACIFAMAERLNITKILTVDRRHFSVFKPEHCESFDILQEKL
ncbi:MAG: type II toxin-antitoxin system VapC family toxin [Blastocatellia bacterium]